MARFIEMTAEKISEAVTIEIADTDVKTRIVAVADVMTGMTAK
jgi:hypothetical protein